MTNRSTDRQRENLVNEQKILNSPVRRLNHAILDLQMPRRSRSKGSNSPLSLESSLMALNPSLLCLECFLYRLNSLLEIKYTWSKIQPFLNRVRKAWFCFPLLVSSRAWNPILVTQILFSIYNIPGRGLKRLKMGAENYYTLFFFCLCLSWKRSDCLVSLLIRKMLQLVFEVLDSTSGA